MKTIHKHSLNTGNEVQELKLTEDAVIRRVDFYLQDRTIKMWVEVDADTFMETPKTVRRFKVFHTGDGIPDNARYTGTTINHMKPDSYHVYELVD